MLLIEQIREGVTDAVWVIAQLQGVIGTAILLSTLHHVVTEHLEACRETGDPPKKEVAVREMPPKESKVAKVDAPLSLVGAELMFGIPDRMTLGPSEGIASEQRMARGTHDDVKHAVAGGRAEDIPEGWEDLKELGIAREAVPQEIIVGRRDFSSNVDR
jgi:hypothetical protein